MPFIFAFVLTFANLAFADLRVFPTRITLNDRTRVNEIAIKHVGAKAMQYKISLVYYLMDKEGGMQLSKEPEKEDHTAVKLIRFSPRQVELPPNTEQVIRVMYNGPKDLAEGEYRAHLFFEPVGEVEPEEKSDKKEEGKMNMRLQARIAVAVPVIYKQGKATFSATLSKLKIVEMLDKQKGFSVEINSEGNAFAFGDLLVYYTPNGKAAQSLGVVRSVASYLKIRKAIYPITLPQDTVLKDGQLKVEFRKTEEEGGELIASTEVKL